MNPVEYILELLPKEFMDSETLDQTCKGLRSPLVTCVQWHVQIYFEIFLVQNLFECMFVSAYAWVNERKRGVWLNLKMLHPTRQLGGGHVCAGLPVVLFLCIS